MTSQRINGIKMNLSAMPDAELTTVYENTMERLTVAEQSVAIVAGELALRGVVDCQMLLDFEV